MMALDSLVLAAVLGAVFFYVLYGVIRAGVRDGILQADQRRQNALGMVRSNGEQG
jgi:hypothetical protein